MPGSAEGQWIGIQWGGQRWALSTRQASAVFQCTRERDSRPALIDLEVHAGAPVFLIPFGDCFGVEGVERDEGSSNRQGWVVVLADVGSSQVGCRVDDVVGPFHSAATAGRVGFEGLDWTVLQRAGARRA